MKSNLIDEILETFWTHRDVRERRIFLMLGSVIALALMYLLLIEPPLSGSKQLDKKIPMQRQKVAEMQSLSQQFMQFSGALTETISPISKETIEASLSHIGVNPVSLTVSDDVIRVQLKQVDYAILMNWLLEMQRVNRLTVDDAKITSLAESAQVDALITLKQQRR